MPAASLYSPAIPSVTQPGSYEAKLPSLDKALRKSGNDKAKALSEISKRSYDAHRWVYREQCECSAHDLGAQWGYYSTAESQWIGTPESEDPDQIRIVVNLTKPIIDQATAMLTAEKPIFGCGAENTTGSARASAIAADEMVKHFWTFHDLDDLYRDTARAAFSTGTAFVQIEWDPSEGPPGVVGAQQPPVLGGSALPWQTPPAAPPMPAAVAADGSLVPPAQPVGQIAAPAAPPILPPKIGPQGDLKFTQLSGEQVAFDPASRKPGGKDGRFIIVRQKLSRGVLMEMFPDKFEEIPEEGFARSQGEFEQEERSQRFSPATGTLDALHDVGEDTVVVDTMYVRASNAFPQGKMFIFTTDILLYEGVNPIYPSYEQVQKGELWPSHRWPVFAFYADTRRNSPWGRARTVDLIPIQKAVNGTFSKAIQHVAIIANAKLLAPKGLDSEFTDELGQVIRYARLYQPGSVQYLIPPQMPAEYMTIINVGREIMENVAGVNAASNGSAPTADASGRLANSLQQRDRTRIDPMKTSIDNEWAEAVTFGLRLCRDYMTQPRKVAIVGDDKAIDVKWLDAAALAAGTVVKVFNDQSIPRDPAMKMNFLAQFSQQVGQIQDPDMKRLLIRLYRLKDFTSFLDEMDPDEVAAENLILKILGGEQLPLGPGAPPPGTAPVPGAPPPPPPGAMPWDHALTFASVFKESLQSADVIAKIAAEKADPRNAGRSPIEETMAGLWSYYTQAAQPAPQPKVILKGDLTPEETAAQLGEKPQPQAAQPMAKAA